MCLNTSRHHRFTYSDVDNKSAQNEKNVIFDQKYKMKPSRGNEIQQQMNFSDVVVRRVV